MPPIARAIPEHEALMAEVAEVKALAKPHEILLVADALDEERQREIAIFGTSAPAR